MRFSIRAWTVMVALFACLACLIPQQSVAQDSDDGQVEASLGIRLIDVTDVDSRNETFSVEAILYIDWQSDPETVGKPGFWVEDGALDRLKQIQPRPFPEFENGRGNRQRNGALLSVGEDGYVTYEERFSLTLGASFDLRRFPFDTQKLAIEILPGADESILALSLSEFSQGRIAMPEWNLAEEPYEARIDRSIRPYDADNAPLFSRAVFQINIERNWVYYFWRVILPLLTITVLSWSVLWMDRKDIGSRLSISFTVLLTIVAFNLIVADALPRIDYLTFIDLLILMTYIWTGAMLALCLHIYRLIGAGHEEKAERFDEMTRRYLPVTYLVGLVLLALSLLI